jgi:tRNA threonylcarbamoyladenosine biosynthesis protein TsaB
MTILALEFSSGQRSVALAGGGNVFVETLESAGRGTSAFSMIEKVLARARSERETVETLAVGLGPGSYTGVRAAIALAQGWQLARGIKTTGVSSAAAIAARARTEKIFGRWNIAINAQREEFYVAAYEISEIACAEIAPLKILPLADLQSRARQGEKFIGPEAAKFFPHGREVFPRALEVAQLAAAQNHFLPGEKLEPIYLRETNFVKAR